MFRELCDEYKQKCYYPLYEIEDGYKANLVEIVEKTLLLQLDEINFQPENDVNLHLEIGVGLDGAGMSTTATGCSRSKKYFRTVLPTLSNLNIENYYWYHSVLSTFKEFRNVIFS